MKNKIKDVVIREFFSLIFILLLGALFMFDPSGSKKFSYPLAMRPEWREKFRIVGQFIFYGGYPLRLLIIFYKWIKKTKSKYTSLKIW